MQFFIMNNVHKKKDEQMRTKTKITQESLQEIFIKAAKKILKKDGLAGQGNLIKKI